MTIILKAAFLLLLLLSNADAIIYVDNATKGGCGGGTTNTTYDPNSRTCGSGTDRVYHQGAGALNAALSAGLLKQGEVLELRGGGVAYTGLFNPIIPNGFGPAGTMHSVEADFAAATAVTTIRGRATETVNIVAQPGLYALGLRDIAEGGNQDYSYISFENLNLTATSPNADETLIGIGSNANHHLKFLNVSANMTGGTCVHGDGRHIWFNGGSYTNCGRLNPAIVPPDTGFARLHSFYNSGDNWLYENMYLSTTWGAGGSSGSAFGDPTKRGYCIQAYPNPTNARIRNNTMTDCAGLVLQNGDPPFGPTEIYGNVFYSVDTGVSNIFTVDPVVYNNTVVDSVGASYSDGFGVFSLYRNNISVNPGNGIHFEPTTSSGAATFSNNICTSLGLGCTIIASAGAIAFVDPSKRDYRLQPTSVAIDAGTRWIRGPTAPSPATCGGSSTSRGTSILINPPAYVATCPDVGAFESGVTPPVIPTLDLVLKMSADGTDADTSGKGNNGTLVGGATYTTLANGKYNQEFELDGKSGAVNIADSDSLDFSHGLALMAWVNPANTPTDFTAVMVKNYLYYLYSSGLPSCAGPLAGFSQAGIDAVVCYGTALPPNTWSHLAFTYDQPTGVLTLFLNGAPVATGTGSRILTPEPGDLQIGASTYGENFQGRIGEVWAYNRAIPRFNGKGDLCAQTALAEASIVRNMGCSINPLVAPAGPAGLTIGSGGSFTIGAGGSVRIGN